MVSWRVCSNFFAIPASDWKCHKFKNFVRWKDEGFCGFQMRFPINCKPFQAIPVAQGLEERFLNEIWFYGSLVD